MKVLILVNSLKWLLTIREELVDRMLQRGYHLGIVGTFDGGEFVFQDKGCYCYDLNVDRRGTSAYADAKLLIGYRRVIREFQPDIALTFSIKPNIYGSMAARLERIPRIVTITGLGSGLQTKKFTSKLVILMYKVSLKGTHCVFFQNSHNYNFMKKHGLISHVKTVRLVSGSGVNLEKFFVQKHVGGQPSPNFLFIGRVMKEKGIEELLEAFMMLSRRYPRSSLHILGSLEEDYEESLKYAMENYPIYYHGEVQDVRPFIKKSSCIVLPSYHEGMANVLLEAAASGRPVIASRIPGCQETFDEGITGLSCEPRNSESLKRAMEAFINFPYEKQRQMGIAGRAKMEREFDRRNVIDAYLEEIEQIQKEQTAS